MSKSVVINLGHGDLNNGFPRVTAQLWAAGHPLPEQFIGSLPAAPDLVELYRNWQSIYLNLCDRKQLISRSKEEDDDELEIDQGGTTNISVVDFHQVRQTLEESINAWFKSEEFLNIDQELRSRLDPAEQIRVIIEINEVLLRRLPWHCWNFFRDYPQAEMALSRPEYKRSQRLQSKDPKNKVRILAILGNSVGINLEAEAKLLNNLKDAEVAFIVKPEREEFNQQLLNPAGWDILFFAGHSQTEGETGRIYINENKTNNSLAIAELETALKDAIERGLKLAIFNSCDGLGLALELEKLNIPTVIVMREPVPNFVAQEFFKYFLEAFAFERLPLYLAVQQARRKLEALENDFPGASWLPAICQNPAVQPPNWLQLGGIPPCPYRGLFAFQEEDARLFFGRETFTQQLVKAVNTKKLVAVIGPSGSGKSSVVFAGLIPHLRCCDIPFKIATFRPGNNPFNSLASALISVEAPESSNIEFTSESKSDPPLPPLDKGGSQNPKSAELEVAIELRYASGTLTRSQPGTLCNIINRILQKSRAGETPTPQEFLQNSNRILQKSRAGETPTPQEFLQKSHGLGERLLLVADQFEELYTLVSEAERLVFLEELLGAVNNTPNFTLVITLRADFLGRALDSEALGKALQQYPPELLIPMNRKELEEAIANPAQMLGVELEEGLTERIINDVDRQPGHLPLLEFALTQLWAKQKDGILSCAAYKEIGGVDLALANHAEQVYFNLSAADRFRSQRIFIQLVHPGEGTEDTRRLATRAEVGEENWDLVTYLASARLVVTGRDEKTGLETVEIVHEALIRSWEKLRIWMQQDRDFRHWQEQLRGVIRQWESSGKDEGALLRGKPLIDAQYWQQQRSDELNSGERSFIQLSLALRDREFKQQKRSRQLTISSLAGGLVLALSIAGVAWWQWQNSAINEIKAISESSQALFASNQKFDALIEAIKAKGKLQKLVGVDTQTQNQVLQVLEQAVYGAIEYNSLTAKNAVWGVAISSDGNIIASGGEKNAVKLWRRDGSLLHTLEGHQGTIWGVAISPDSQLIASASEDKTVKLWSRDGQELNTLRGPRDRVWAVAFSPDSNKVAAVSQDGLVYIWSREGKLIKRLTGIKTVAKVTFTPNGNIVAASEDGSVKIWSIDGKQLPTLEAHIGPAWGLAVSPDGSKIIAGFGDGTVKIWSPDGKEILSFKGHSDSVMEIAFRSDGKVFATASKDKTIKIWSLDGRLVTTLNGHSDRVNSVAFAPDGNALVSASEDRRIKFWKLNHELLTFLRGHEKPVIGVRFGPDGKFVASASDDSTVKLWSKDGTLLRTLKGHKSAVLGVDVSKDGQTIASASWDKTVKLWNSDGSLRKTLVGHQAEVWGVAISPDSRIIASASKDATIKLWDSGGNLLKTLRGHQGDIRDVTFSPDGKTIASASSDYTVKLWKLDGTLVKTLNGHHGGVIRIAFSSNGRILASASLDNTVKLWKTDGTLLKTINAHNNGVRGVSFSPDGKTIATAGGDNTVKLWNLDGTLLRILRGHSNPVWAVSFSPDGKTIASSSEDKTVILWNSYRVQNLDPLAFACDWVRDYLKHNPYKRHLCDRIN
ncbi:nSTAND1 domain-containing NTPase [Microseira wollei]